jgi:DNA-binding transcriptional LysR family regulator
MAGCSTATGLPRSPRAVEPLPAAARLKPSLLLSLQAFDAAVRLGGFKPAAAALHITPSAVSHRIRKLEQALGERLFRRVHRGVQPTGAAKTLATATGRAFAELARVAAPADHAGHRRLRITVTPLFASDWLIPRMASFMAAHADLDLVIESSTRDVDFDTEPYDAGIRIGDGKWAGLATAHLMDIFSVPVAAPALARRLKLKRPADLVRAPLIHVTPFPNAWTLWCRHAGVPRPDSLRAIWVDSFGAALLAAEQGLGVALGLAPLFAAREQAGQLCQPIAVRQPIDGCWLVHRKADAGHAGLKAFKRWLLAEAASVK